LAQGGQLLTVSWAKQTVIAHLDEAFGEDVLQKAVDELLSRQGAELGFPGARSAVAEGDLIILDFHETAVTDRDAKDVRGEILEGGEAVADRQAMDDPVLFPYGGRDTRKTLCRAQCVAELGAKELRERLNREEKVGPGG